MLALLIDVASVMVPRSGGGADAALRDSGLGVGILGATVMTAGLVAICVRGLPGHGGVPRAPTAMDWLTVGLLLTVLCFGLWEAVGINAVLVPHDNGLTIGGWARDLFTLRPDASTLDSVTVDDRWHLGTIMVLVALWPYTHLVHAWHGIARALSTRGRPVRPTIRRTGSAA